MRLFLTYLPVLGCAGIMVACIRMMRGHGAGEKRAEARSTTELEEEVARLRARIALSPDHDPAGGE